MNNEEETQQNYTQYETQYEEDYMNETTLPIPPLSQLDFFEGLSSQLNQLPYPKKQKVITSAPLSYTQHQKSEKKSESSIIKRKISSVPTTASNIRLEPTDDNVVSILTRLPRQLNLSTLQHLLSHNEIKCLLRHQNIDISHGATKQVLCEKLLSLFQRGRFSELHERAILLQQQQQLIASQSMSNIPISTPFKVPTTWKNSSLLSVQPTSTVSSTAPSPSFQHPTAAPVATPYYSQQFLASTQWTPVAPDSGILGILNNDRGRTGNGSSKMLGGDPSLPFLRPSPDDSKWRPVTAELAKTLSGSSSKFNASVIDEITPKLDEQLALQGYYKERGVGKAVGRGKVASDQATDTEKISCSERFRSICKQITASSLPPPPVAPPATPTRVTPSVSHAHTQTDISTVTRSSSTLLDSGYQSLPLASTFACVPPGHGIKVLRFTAPKLGLTLEKAYLTAEFELISVSYSLYFYPFALRLICILYWMS